MPNTAKDPVCGMNVDTRTSAKRAYQGNELYFCSEACREKFSSDPDSYTTPHP